MSPGVPQSAASTPRARGVYVEPSVGGALEAVLFARSGVPVARVQLPPGPLPVRVADVLDLLLGTLDPAPPRLTIVRDAG